MNKASRDKLQRDDDDNVICSLDNMLIKDHVRCQNCHILIGPAHHEKQTHEHYGRIICGNCRLWIAKRANMRHYTK